MKGWPEQLKSLSDLLRALSVAEVDFILVGGVAAAAHGSARLTQDVVYRRGNDNLDKVVRGLSSARPYLLGAPPGLPFHFDVPTLARGLNFALTTDLGSIDLLGEISGGGRYEDLVQHCVLADAFGVRCRVLDLPTLIATKRAAGRPKDFEAIAELELLHKRSK